MTSDNSSLALCSSPGAPVQGQHVKQPFIQQSDPGAKQPGKLTPIVWGSSEQLFDSVILYSYWTHKPNLLCYVQHAKYINPPFGGFIGNQEI